VGAWSRTVAVYDTRTAGASNMEFICRELLVVVGEPAVALAAKYKSLCSPRTETARWVADTVMHAALQLHLAGAEPVVTATMTSQMAWLCHRANESSRRGPTV